MGALVVYVHGFHEVASFACLLIFFCLRGNAEEGEEGEAMQGCNAEGRGASWSRR